MRKLSLKDYLIYFAPAIVMTFAGFIVAYQFIDPAPPTQITIATGRSTGVYYEFGTKFSQILARDGVTLKVKETSGSVENLNLITDKGSGVDLIFLQGGVGSLASTDDLISLGSLYFEPLWVFHRADIQVRYLADLKKMRIAAGVEGSGTKVLAMQLLAFNGVNSVNSHIEHIGANQAVEKLRGGEIDAAFFVIAYRKNTRPELLFAPDIKLMSFQLGEAYTRRLHFLSLHKLPEGTFDFARRIPDKDIFLLAPTAQLVVRTDFHPALVDLLIQASQEVGTPAGVFERQGDFPSPKYIDFPLSKDAKRFYEHGQPILQRFLPFWLANLLYRMKIMLLPLIVLLFPLFKLLPPFYQWRVRYRIYSWYKELMRIDAEILNRSPQQPTDQFTFQLDTIEKQVSQISVPLGFSRELYDMRVHIQLLRERLLTDGVDRCPETVGSETKNRQLPSG